MEPFHISPDMVTTLNEMDDKELQFFAGLVEGEIELHIFALFLAFERTGDRVFLERAIDRAQEWITSIMTPAEAEDEPDTVAADGNRRQSILDILSGRLNLLGDEGDNKEAAQKTEDQEQEQLEPEDFSGQVGMVINWSGPFPGIPIPLAGSSIDSNFARQVAAYTTNLPDDLDEAFGMVQSTIITVDNPEQQSIIFALFGDQYGNRFEAAGDMDDIDKAINAFRIAEDAIPPDSLRRASLLSSLAIVLRTRWKATDSESHLLEAITTAKAAVDATPHDDSNRVDRLFKYLALLGFKDARTSDTETGDDEEILRAALALLEVLPLDHPQRAFVIRISAARLGAKFYETQDIEDLDRAITVLNEVMDSHSHLGEEQLQLLEMLEYSLDLRFKTIRKTTNDNTEAEVERALGVIERALSITSPDDSDWVTWLVHLRDWLKRQNKMTNRPEVIDRLIDVCRMILDAVPRDSEDYEEALGGHYGELAHMLDIRFRRTNRAEDIEDAIKAAHLSLNAMNGNPTDKEEWFGRLLILSNVIGSRFDLTGTAPHLDEWIKYTEMAADALYNNSSLCDDPGAVLNNLSLSLGRRFEQRGAADDLNRAIDTAHKAVNITALGHPDRANRLNTLALWIGTRFEINGSMDDLNAAIDAAQAAVDTDSTDYQLHAILPSNLEMWLSKRFKRTGNEEDLTRSIGLTEKAIEMLSEGDPNLGLMMINLSNRLTTGAANNAAREHPEAAKLLDKAIAVLKKGSDLLGQDHPLRGVALFSLGQLFRERYVLVHDPEDLMNAVDVARRALDDLPRDHPNRALFLLSFGKAVEMRYWYTVTFENITDCFYIPGIDLPEDGEEAGETLPIPDDETTKAQDACPRYRIPPEARRRFKMPRLIEDFEGSINSYIEGWNCENAAPFMRIRLARAAAEGLSKFSEGGWKEVSKTLRGAVELLPVISPRAILKDSDRQEMLSDCAGLASSAAAAALNAGEKPEDALALLELGRGIIAGLLLENRSDITDLEEKHPDIAKGFKALQDELESLDSDTTPQSHSIISPTELELKSKRRWDASEKFSKMLEEIRALSGFDTFLLPPTTADMLAAADPDPIVVVNASSYRCDAFIVWKQRVEVLKLPDLKLEEVETKAKLLRTTTNAGPVLDWLWKVAACPIMEALGFVGDPETREPKQLPRIWWVLTGALSQLPFHAAGIHRPAGVNSGTSTRETVLDRAMSSYTLSIKALIYGRRKKLPKLSATDRYALLIAMQTTPGLPSTADLPCTAEEVAVLESLCPTLGLTPAQPSRSREEVLAALRTCEVFHFAGHGEVDPLVPSKSLLLLDDWQNNPLTVEHIRQQRLVDGSGGKGVVGATPPFLGYLSACSTGSNTVKSLVDESIHLISACQLAGFRHVIGTLWEVSDEFSVDVARVFYETLHEEGMAAGSMCTDKGVCRALHRAVKTLRDADIRGIGRRRKVTGAGSEANDDDEEGSDTHSEVGEEEKDFGVSSGKIGEEGTTRDGGDQTDDFLVQEEGMGERSVVVVTRKRRRMLFNWVPYVHYGV